MNMPDGGSAYPALDTQYHQPGMTLRDYFAGQALTLAGPTLAAGEEIADAVTPEAGKQYRQSIYRKVARDVYLIADAMLAERSKPG